MTNLWWVRHGPTHARALVGWTDIPADLTDHAALARLADYLPADALITSSDLIRASATAEAIAGNRRLLPADSRLRELNFGAWEMQSASQVEDQALARAYWETPGDIAPPEGESWNAASTRISAGADDLVRAHPGADIIVVAHMGAILTQLQRALRQPTVRVFSQVIDNLSVTRLSIADDWQAHEINHRP